ncbi:MAG TPA: DUF6249 domain-containing protein [Chitinophagales bacterium]|nr:DUF6249 domain-containing protein [Chitinophagales bacterium]
MDLNAIFGELIGMVSVVGGLGVGAYAIYIGYLRGKERRDAISKERQLLIEKGMDPALAYQEMPQNYRASRPLLWGLTLAGVGLGLLLGSTVAKSLGMDEDKLTLACALIFGGIGMVVYYVNASKKN